MERNYLQLAVFRQRINRIEWSGSNLTLAILAFVISEIGRGNQFQGVVFIPAHYVLGLR